VGAAAVPAVAWEDAAAGTFFAPLPAAGDAPTVLALNLGHTDNRTFCASLALGDQRVLWGPFASPAEAAQSQTPLFGLAYHPLQVSSFGNLVLPSLQFGESDRFTGFM
jgi:hypothetical protein